MLAARADRPVLMSIHSNYSGSLKAIFKGQIFFERVYDRVNHGHALFSDR
jgi:hypothetical protein